MVTILLIFSVLGVLTFKNPSSDLACPQSEILYHGAYFDLQVPTLFDPTSGLENPAVKNFSDSVWLRTNNHNFALYFHYPKLLGFPTDLFRNSESYSWGAAEKIKMGSMTNLKIKYLDNETGYYKLVFLDEDKFYNPAGKKLYSYVTGYKSKSDSEIDYAEHLVLCVHESVVRKS